MAGSNRILIIIIFEVDFLVNGCILFIYFIFLMVLYIVFIQFGKFESSVDLLMLIAKDSYGIGPSPVDLFSDHFKEVYHGNCTWW